MAASAAVAWRPGCCEPGRTRRPVVAAVVPHEGRGEERRPEFLFLCWQQASVIIIVVHKRAMCQPLLALACILAQPTVCRQRSPPAPPQSTPRNVAILAGSWH